MLRRYPSLRTFRSTFISPSPSTLSDGEECCICLDPYDGRSHQAVGVTSNSDCKHVFGRQCLEAYLDSTNPVRNTCPVCRRKWYTRRITNPLTPRDTNTAQILAPFDQLRASARDVAEPSVPQRHTSGGYLHTTDNTTMGRHVEQLVYNMESIETLEATATQLDQEVRVRLRQIQGRIRAFLDRNDEAADAFVNAAVRRSRSHNVLQSTAEQTSRYLPEFLVVGLDHGQDPYSLLGVAFQNNTLLPEPLVPRSQTSQYPNGLQLSPNPVPNNREQPPVLTRTAGGRSRSTVLMPRDNPLPSSLRRGGTRAIPRSAVNSHQRQGGRLVLRHSPDDFQSHQSTNSRDMEYMRAYWNGGFDNDDTRYSRPLSSHRFEHSQVAELEGTLPPLLFAGTAANQVMNRRVNDRHAFHAENFATERHRTIPSRIPHLRRTNNTLGFAYDSHPVGTPPQSILSASRVERRPNLRIRAIPNSLQDGISRLMNISGLCDVMARNRTR